MNQQKQQQAQTESTAGRPPSSDVQMADAKTEVSLVGEILTHGDHEKGLADETGHVARKTTDDEFRLHSPHADTQGDSESVSASQKATTEFQVAPNDMLEMALLFHDIQHAEASLEPRISLREQIKDANGAAVEDDVDHVLQYQQAYVHMLAVALCAHSPAEPRSVKIDLNKPEMRTRWKQFQNGGHQRYHYHLQRGYQPWLRAVEKRLWDVLKEVVAIHRNSSLTGQPCEEGITCSARVSAIAQVIEDFTSARADFLEPGQFPINIPYLVATPKSYAIGEYVRFQDWVRQADAWEAARQLGKQATQPVELAAGQGNAAGINTSGQQASKPLESTASHSQATSSGEGDEQTSQHRDISDSGPQRQKASHRADTGDSDQSMISSGDERETQSEIAAVTEIEEDLAKSTQADDYEGQTKVEGDTDHHDHANGEGEKDKASEAHAPNMQLPAILTTLLPQHSIEIQRQKQKGENMSEAQLKQYRWDRKQRKKQRRGQRREERAQRLDERNELGAEGETPGEGQRARQHKGAQDRKRSSVQ